MPGALHPTQRDGGYRNRPDASTAVVPEDAALPLQPAMSRKTSTAVGGVPAQPGVSATETVLPRSRHEIVAPLFGSWLMTPGMPRTVTGSPPGGRGANGPWLTVTAATVSAHRLSTGGRGTGPNVRRHVADRSGWSKPGPSVRSDQPFHRGQGAVHEPERRPRPSEKRNRPAIMTHDDPNSSRCGQASPVGVPFEQCLARSVS